MKDEWTTRRTTSNGYVTDDKSVGDDDYNCHEYNHAYSSNDEDINDKDENEYSHADYSNDKDVSNENESENCNAAYRITLIEDSFTLAAKVTKIAIIANMWSKK